MITESVMVESEIVEFSIADVPIVELFIEVFIIAESVIRGEFISSESTRPGTIVRVSIISFTVLSCLEMISTFTV